MNNFVEKTILSIQNIFEDMFYSDIISSKKSIMQALDTRVKLLSVIALIIIVNFGKSIFFMAVFLIYSLLLAVFSKIPIKAYILRISTVSILFTGIVLTPSLFNVLRPGDPLLFFTRNIYITKQGFYNAVIFMMRSLVSLSFVYILVLSTKWVEILRALRFFKLPRIFTSTLEMALRYIFLFLELSSNIFLARKSRNVGKTSSGEGRKFVAASIGNILIKSEALSNDVYSAMISRGYSGEYITVKIFKMGLFDYVWIIFNLIFVTIVAFKI